MINKGFSFFLFLTLSSFVLAGTGNFFSISESGIATPLNITLCLNGTGPLTCQNYAVNHRVLDISTVTSGHSYPAIGIKINTPGYMAVEGCTYISNGYCIFSASDTSQATVVIGLTSPADPGDVILTVSGTPLGLNVSGPTGSSTVTNTSSTITATDISSDFSGTALQGKVEETGNTCQILAPNSSCTLTFTPGADAVSATQYLIQGLNTSGVGAVIAVDAAAIAEVTVDGSPLSLQTSGVTGDLTITNTSSSITATNIAADFTGTALAGKVTQTRSTCSSVSPGASCTLTFSPGATTVAETTFPIQGTNTNSVNASISITSPLNAHIGVSNSPLILNVNGPAGTLSISNLSSTVTATNITSNFTGTALSGNVSESGNTCTSVSPGSSCTLTYTPGSTAVTQTTFTIQGTNTNTINAAIQIDALSIGTDFGGGKVGCLTSQGQVANLIVAKADARRSLVWSNTLTFIGATSTINGSANTASIVSSIGLSPAFAAPRCHDYQIDSTGHIPCRRGNTCYKDWYLPATDELNCLKGNQSAIGGFVSDLYWSSTEVNKNSARAISFANGSTPAKNKSSYELKVRCVRSFTP